MLELNRMWSNVYNINMMAFTIIIYLYTKSVLKSFKSSENVGGKDTARSLDVDIPVRNYQQTQICI